MKEYGQVKRDGLPSLIVRGGRAYECSACHAYVTADCMCCEPPRHSCAPRNVLDTLRAADRAEAVRFRVAELRANRRIR